ncbi:hypothetical protein KA036_01375 [Candidatus Gracilibacteria bacterium]|jgi:hypothetical protein|nr:hypothetical protein [Candidatus Gracilibacteria bacterium]
MLDLDSLTFILQVTTEGSVIDSIQDNGSIIELVNKAIAYALIIAGALSVFYIFYGGITFILSGGDEDKIKQAVGTIRYAIIGLIITIFTVIIVNAVGRFIGLNTINYINFREIIQTVEQISEDIRRSNTGGGINSL